MYQQLRDIRNQKAIPAREMADLLGLKTEAAYYKKETGLVRFSLHEAKIVSARLEMPVETVFFVQEVSNNETA